MEMEDAKQLVLEYLTVRGLEFYLRDEEMDTTGPEAEFISIVYDEPDLVCKVIESEINFGDSELIVRVFYPETVSHACRSSDDRDALLRMLNLLNANYFPRGLYSPYLYLSTDGAYDIVLRAEVPYFIFEQIPERTLEFLTDDCLHYLELFDLPICGLLFELFNEQIALFYVGANLNVGPCALNGSGE